MGVVVAVVELQSLTQLFLGTIRISEATQVYMLDENGSLVFNSASPTTIGVSINDYLGGLRLVSSGSLNEDMQELLRSQVDRRLLVAYSNPETGKSTVRFLVYTPLIVKNQQWGIFITSPLF